MKEKAWHADRERIAARDTAVQLFILGLTYYTQVLG